MTKQTPSTPPQTSYNTTPQADKPKARIFADPELLAMNRLTKTLNSLESAQRRRVVDWLMSKYGTPPQEQAPCGSSTKPS